MEPCNGDLAVEVAVFNFYVKVTVKVFMYILFIGSQISLSSLLRYLTSNGSPETSAAELVLALPAVGGSHLHILIVLLESFFK